MKKVFKYRIEQVGVMQDINLPFFSKFLDAQIQGDYLVIWALVPVVNPDAPMECRTIIAHPTGCYIEEAVKYIATAQDGPLVWHVFEVIS